MIHADFPIEPSPCTDCPNQSDGYCNFYREVLDKYLDGVAEYIPCADCTDDCTGEEP